MKRKAFNIRDDFSQKTKDILFRRARARCSNPECRKVTCEAHSEADKAVNIGEAAHMTAASPGSFRYDPALSAEERKSADNGIWLCGTCAKLIDSDTQKYTVELLRKWKTIAEAGDERETARMAVFSKIEKMMPELLEEMRQDLAEYPIKREFILKGKSVTYNSGGEIFLSYHYETHAHLDDKITILCNHGLIEDITYNNVKRYTFTEEFVDYLTQAS
jgi:hypothetical protein